jgi:hypothetical protein
MIGVGSTARCSVADLPSQRGELRLSIGVVLFDLPSLDSLSHQRRNVAAIRQGSAKAGPASLAAISQCFFLLTDLTHSLPHW